MLLSNYRGAWILLTTMIGTCLTIRYGPADPYNLCISICTGPKKLSCLKNHLNSSIGIGFLPIRRSVLSQYSTIHPYMSCRCLSVYRDMVKGLVHLFIVEVFKGPTLIFRVSLCLQCCSFSFYLGSLFVFKSHALAKRDDQNVYYCVALKFSSSSLQSQF